MRIRSTRPEFWRSERIASVDWDARLVLKGLESYVDDNGVGKDDVVMIVSDVFPRDLAREPSRTLARVSVAIDSLSEAGLVHRYEVDGDRLLFMAFWESVQRIDRPAKGRLPRPDGTFEYGASEIRESVANPREPSRALATGTGEQGNRGTEDQGTGEQAHDSVVEAFEDAWSHWPKKEKKKPALNKFRTASKKRGIEQLAEDVARFGDAYRSAGVEVRFVPALDAWLNQERWSDPLPQPRGAHVTAFDRNLEVARRAHEQEQAEQRALGVGNA